MSDRELLELAAKVAGIEHRGHCEFGLVTGDLHDSAQWQGAFWNPLTDDGDALRLAVKLNLDILFRPEPDGPIVVCEAAYDIEMTHTEDKKFPYIFENLEGSRSAEHVRLCIVRAAAELAKSMPATKE